MKLFLLCAVLWLGSGSAQEFQGCFKNLDFSKGLSREFKSFNINADCAAFCGSQGYILAATHGAKCTCTNVAPTPDKMVASPQQLKVLEGSNGDSECNTPCPGSLVKSGERCIGDECCGGTTRRRKRYSLYAVGGINPVPVLLRRIYRSIVTRDHSSWLEEDIAGAAPTCYNNFIEVTSEHGFLTFDKKLRIMSDFQTAYYADTVDECKQACTRHRDQRKCQSITFDYNAKTCTLYLGVTSVTGHVTKAEHPTAIFDRNCSRSIEVLPMSFQLEAVKQNSNEFVIASTLENSDEDDIEMDLTESNNFETTRRSVTLRSSQDVTLNTQSGLVTSRSTSVTDDSTHSNSATSSFSSSTTLGGNTGFGYSASASVSGGFWGVSASLETEFRGDHDQSHSDTTQNSESKTDSTTESEQTSESRSRSDMFDMGYSKTTQREHSQFFDYSMTVPAYHKGTIRFFIKKQRHVKKISTDLRLTGSLKLKIRDGTGEAEVRQVSVARILSPKERQVSVMSEEAYQKDTLLAKVIIVDPDGNTVESLRQAVEEEK